MDDIHTFIKNQTRFQTSGAFLQKMGEQYAPLLLEKCLKQKPTEVECIQIISLMKDASIKNLSYKIINITAFIPAITFSLIGISWPFILKLLKYFFAYEIGAPESGLIQTAIISIAGLLFSIYVQYKKRQTAIEILMRETLFREEEFSKKIERVIKVLGVTDTGLEIPQNILKPEVKSKEAPKSNGI